MAYPGEQTHVGYLKYVESVASGETPGPQLAKDQWLAQQAKKLVQPTPAVSSVADALMKKK